MTCFLCCLLFLGIPVFHWFSQDNVVDRYWISLKTPGSCDALGLRHACAADFVWHIGEIIEFKTLEYFQQPDDMGAVAAESGEATDKKESLVQ